MGSNAAGKDPFAKLWNARSLHDAQYATAHLFDVVTPGGAAVELTAGPWVVRLRKRPGIASHPYRAYILAVLEEMARCIRAWRKHNDSRPSMVLNARHEEAIEQELCRFCRQNPDLIANDDPQTRAIAALLEGRVGPLDTVADRLMERYRIEPHPVTQAAVMVGLLNVVIRLDDEEGRALGATLTQMLAAASQEAIGRANAELTHTMHGQEELDRLTARVTVPKTTYRPRYWQAEEI